MPSKRIGGSKRGIYAPLILTFMTVTIFISLRLSNSSIRLTLEPGDVPPLDGVGNGNKAGSSPKHRRVSGTGDKILYADWIYDSATGSFWLPRPPPSDKLVGGYEVRPRNISAPPFSPREYNKTMYEGKEGFMLEHHVRIMMSETYNAGDFLSCFVSPMIAGRPVSLRDANNGNRMSLNVVGSILHWGIRYSWGPGFIQEDKGASTSSEIVFATRGPRSYEKFKRTMPPGAKIHKAYGDAGSLLSWFYQPRNQTKEHGLCLLPHYGDKRVPFMRNPDKWWKGPAPHYIDIMSPLFGIADAVVKCEFVLSSSLHGIIFSDSYNVPNAHVKYREHVMGGHYKFHDYFESVGRKYNDSWLDMEDESLWASGKVVDFVEKQREQYDISGMQLMPFWESCPMHAEAYNRTRRRHLDFARMFAKTFDELLVNRPANFSYFHKLMSEKVGSATTPVCDHLKRTLWRTDDSISGSAYEVSA